MFLPLALFLAAAAPASATTWVHKPTSDELKVVWPTISAETRAGGWADLICDLTRQGSPVNCKVQGEYPQGSGFGDIALKIVSNIHETPSVRGERVQNQTEQALKFSVTPDGQRSVDFARVREVDWLRRPTPDQIQSVYPVGAYKNGENGTAIIKCDVTILGRLANCVGLAEDPPGRGFADAAVALTPQLLFKPRTIDGTPTRGEVRIPIAFKTFGRPSPSETITLSSSAIAWAKAPSVDDVRAAYPEGAKAAKRGGQTNVLCKIGGTGELADCDVTMETPRGLGLGDAARELIRGFQAPTTTRAGTSLVGANITVPFTFAPTIFDTTPVVGRPVWASLPSSEEFNSAYAGLPTQADSLAAVLDCAVQPGGSVDACRVASETPAGSGFGERALRLAPGFRLTTWTDAGFPVVGARVNIPLRLKLDGAAAPAKP